MHVLQAVDADAQVIELRGGNSADVVLADERAVGGQCNKETELPRMVRQLEKIWAQQRLATRQNEYPHAGRVQVVDDAQGLVGVELVAKRAVGRCGIAVLAGEVAAAQQIPDDDRGPRAARCSRTRLGHGIGPGKGAQVMADSQHRVLGLGQGVWAGHACSIAEACGMCLDGRQ